MIPTSFSYRNAQVRKNVDFDLVGVLGIFFPGSSSVKTKPYQPKLKVNPFREFF